MSDFNAENDRLLFDIEQFCLINGASDFVHYFLRFNYNKIREKQIIKIFAPVDAALQRLVNKVGKSLEEISNLPEGIDVLNNFLSSDVFNRNHPFFYTAINGTTYGKSASDISRLRSSIRSNFGNIEIWIINSIIHRNERQIEALARAGSPQSILKRNTGIIGSNTVSIIQRDERQIEALARAGSPQSILKRNTGIIGSNTVTNFDELPGPIVRKIVLDLSLEDTINSCWINNQFNSLICSSEDFWNEKTRKDHPTQKSMIGGSWKETYKMLTGKLYTFGSNARGQLGHPRETESILVNNLINVTAVSAGLAHTAVVSDGFLYTFGSSRSGKLGHGNEDDEDLLQPKRVKELINVTAVACGDSYTAVVAGGYLYTFGYGGDGQLGHGNDKNQLRPKLVEGLDNVSFVVCGSYHTAVISNGLLYTFGPGFKGQLGHGDQQNQFRPKLVEGLDNVTAVACGDRHTAVISKDHLYTFGYNGFGQLGNDNQNNQSTPILIETLGRVTFVAAGGDNTAIIVDSQLYTFGAGSSGQLGQDNKLPRFRPTLVSSLTNVNFVSCGYTYTAIISGGYLYTFGTGLSGQLGYTFVYQTNYPKQVEGLNHVIAVACGREHTAVIAIGKQ